MCHLLKITVIVYFGSTLNDGGTLVGNHCYRGPVKSDVQRGYGTLSRYIPYNMISCFNLIHRQTRKAISLLLTDIYSPGVIPVKIKSKHFRLSLSFGTGG